MKKRFYSLYKNAEEKHAEIYIYGDITSWPWFEDEVSSYTLSKELQELGDVDNIEIFINSYGGEVAEGLAIYNALKRHPAKITTYVDGFACSIASVIFAAGDERIMSNTSLMMIHNAMTSLRNANANEMKKQADDLDKINQAAINAYMNIVNVEEDEIKELMDKETWLNADEALSKGFITSLVENEKKEVATQSIRDNIIQKITKEERLTATVELSEKGMQDIVDRKLEEFKASFKMEKTEDEKPKNENKVNSFMRAFFNVENEEENNNEKTV